MNLEHDNLRKECWLGGPQDIGWEILIIGKKALVMHQGMKREPNYFLCHQKLEDTLAGQIL